MKAEKNDVYLENLKLVFDEPGMIHVATTLEFSFFHLGISLSSYTATV